MSLDSEDNWRTHITFLQPNEYNTFTKCPTTQNMEQKITFTIQRDDSTHTSVIRYRRQDNGKYESLTFNTGYSDHTSVTYDGEFLTCTGSQPQCNQLEVDKPVRASIYEIDFNPRDGNAHENNWSRNKYTISASYYGTVKKCKGMLSTVYICNFLL